MMTLEDKKLLVRDLMARIPFGVKVEHIPSGFISKINNIVLYPLYNGNDIKDYICSIDFFGDGEYFDIDNFRPHLRPLSTMTDSEKEEYYDIVGYISPDDTETLPECEFIYINSCDKFEALIYFYHSHHLDYRGLIEKGLAIYDSVLDNY